MVDTAAKTCMLIFVRHGERMDQVSSPTESVHFKYDPQLTETGMQQAAEAAKLTSEFLT